MNTQEIHTEHGESKAGSTPFLMFYTSDWIAGTAGFTFEQQGFYSAVLFRMWEMKSGVPDDVRWIANHLSCDPRTARRLRDFLVKEGKLEARDGFLVNGRMMREIAKVIRRERKPVKRNFAPTSALTSPELRPDFEPKLDLKFPETPIISTKPTLKDPPHSIFHTPESRQKDSHTPSRLESEPEDRVCEKFASPIEELKRDGLAPHVLEFFIEPFLARRPFRRGTTDPLTTLRDLRDALEPFDERTLKAAFAEMIEVRKTMPLDIEAKARCEEISGRPSGAQFRVNAGETAFNAWVSHLRSNGKSFEAKYWEQKGYALVPCEFPPIQHCAA